VVALAWSVVIGAAGQFLIQLPGLSSQIGRLYHRAIQWDLPAAREVLQLFVPRVVGVAAFQAMLLITLYLASRLPQGMVAAINYSWLLISFPLGAIGTAAATAIFPAVSRLTSASDAAAIRRTVNRGLRFVVFLTLPSAAGLVVLRRPIVNLLYGFALSHHYAEQVAFALLFYALALPALSTIEVTPRVFYALKDTVTPVRIAIVAVALDAFLSILFVNMMPKRSGQGGLALATAIATSIQAVWLLAVLQVRLGGIGVRSLYGTLRDATVASFAMAVVLYVLLDPLTAIFAQHGIGVFVTVVLEVGIGAATFGGIAYLLGAPELWEVRNFLPRTR
jgi:putative peptidoglycan lipid II flippase